MKSGSLRERSPGRWQYRVGYGSHADGRPRYRSATFSATSQTAAERKARTIRVDWDRAETAAVEAQHTVGGLASKWIETRQKLSPNTAYRYQSILARLTADLGHVRLDALTALDLDHWYIALAKPRKDKRTLTPNTIRYYHKVLRAILNQGVKWDLVARNVADRATPPVAERHDQADRMPTMPALQLMIGKASRTVRMAVLLAAATGCRRAELVGLIWSDIDADGILTVQRALFKQDGKLGVKGTKTGAVKRIPLNPSLLAELVKFRAENADWARRAGSRLADDGPILAHLRADATGRTPFQPDWLSQEWERLCKRAGVAPFKLHGLRHLHVTALHDAGVATALIQARTGHASAQTVERHYLHTIPAAELEVGRTVVEDVFSLLFADRAPI